MCLILSVLAMLVYLALFVSKSRRNLDSKSAKTTFLMFLGASLMWSVDGFAAAMNGESFLDLSREDLFLGLIVVCAGSAYYIVSQKLKTKGDIL